MLSFQIRVEELVELGVELRLESSVIGSGNGFDEANKATISVDLPLAQYSSNPVFYISVETVDGTVHDITRTVNPLPMRTVQVEFKDSLVVGEEAEFEWRLEGIYLNQMDNIQKIDVVLYSLTNNLVHQEQYFGNATSGRELVLLPESINPGTYNVVIRFSFADGTDYSHIETAQVLAEPEGINVLGITIPPLMMGLDTLLVIGLLIHAVLLQRRMKSSDEDEVVMFPQLMMFEDEYTMPLLDDLDGQQVDANHLDELERNDWTNANSEVGSSEVSNPDREGSGRFWSRNSVDDWDSWIDS